MAYQRCTRCVMDNSGDSFITFDGKGVCNYCTEAFDKMNAIYFPNKGGEEKITEMVEKIKARNKNKKYDCIMGISGGLDSSYLAYLGYKWGLRILAVHIDDGYDTQISKENIKKLCAAAKIELRTITPDADQYNALIRAYMRAGVPNIAVPQDDILFAFLYDTLVKEDLKYFLSGSNFALEGILQKDHIFPAYDTTNIFDIFKKNKDEGDSIDNLKFISFHKRSLLQKAGKIETLAPLNYVDYNRDKAFKELSDFCGFEYYGRKHLENILTAFVQLYWFPRKFNVDKRTSHLSSMIVSGQMTRDDALKQLEEPLYDEAMMADYIALIKNNLHLSDKEFDDIMSAPVHMHEEYATDRIRKVKSILRGNK